jgi:lysophospholipase
LTFNPTSYVAGTSSTLFNQAFLIVNSSEASIVQSAINGILQQIGENQNDVAIYPNSFHNWDAETSPVRDSNPTICIIVGSHQKACLLFETAQATT